MSNKKIKHTTDYRFLTFFLLVAIIILQIVNLEYVKTISQSHTASKTTNYAMSPTNYGNGSQLITYSHPQLQYTLQFPSDWREVQYETPAGPAIQPYFDLLLYSPDFSSDSLVKTNDLNTGSFIFVRGIDTQETSIDSKFNNNNVAKSIAKNITKKIVDGVSAIQYEYTINNNSEQGSDVALNTVFIKNGIWYLIKLQSASQIDQDKNMQAYQTVLNSFKAR